MPNLTETALTVLNKRYYLKSPSGVIVEDWSDLCNRVSSFIASIEGDKFKLYHSLFYDMIFNLDFLPNSPCLMNAGTDIGQLSACFVLDVDDSMEGIFTAIKNGAIVHKCLSGDTEIITGNNISKLLKDVNPGDYVQDRYGKFNKVLELIPTGCKKLYQIASSCDLFKPIYATEDHKFLVSKVTKKSSPILKDVQWATVKEISNDVDSYVFVLGSHTDKNGYLELNDFFQYIRISSVLEAGEGDTYNLHVENIHEYQLSSRIVSKNSGGGCLETGTPVLTPEGLVPIEDIKLLSNTVDGEVSFTKTWQTGEGVKIEVEGFPPVRYTNDHPILIRKTFNSESTEEFINASDVKVGDFVKLYKPEEEYFVDNELEDLKLLVKLAALFIASNSAVFSDHINMLLYASEYKLLLELLKNFNNSQAQFVYDEDLGMFSVTISNSNDFIYNFIASFFVNGNKIIPYNMVTYPSEIINSFLLTINLLTGGLFEDRNIAIMYSYLSYLAGNSSLFSCLPSCNEYKVSLTEGNAVFFNNSIYIRVINIEEVHEPFIVHNLTTESHLIHIPYCTHNTGYSFSDIRPKNAPVLSTQGVASGPLSFARVFNAATETIKQGGKRRGANMGVLSIHHPDIIEFIKAKQVEGDFNNFNFSVAITDSFMEAVINNIKYPLIDPRTKEIVEELDAVEVFDLIVQFAHKNGEPGVLFIDAANRANPTPHLGDFKATNPCGEQFLNSEESCNLGSINLSNFVIDNSIDYNRLESTTKTAVRFLDNVIDLNKYPLPEIERATLLTRKVGLGIMGLHDMLIQLEIPYASDKGLQIASEVMNFIHDVANNTSISLAEEKEKFPAYEPNDIVTVPRRNAALTSIQPTGTVSMIADCASGCEPYFSIVTEKHALDGDKLILVNKYFELVSRREGFFSDILMKKIADTGTVIGHPEIPLKYQEIFRTTQDIDPNWHIKMQAVLQSSGVDSSISKTINMSNSATKEDVAKAYKLAHSLGCKGLTIYRDGSRNEQVLYSGSTPKDGKNSTSSSKMKLPDELPARRYKLKGSDGIDFYILICYDDYENPMEVFAKFPYDNRPEYDDKATMWTTVCRLASISLRYGIPTEEVIKQLDRSSGHMRDLPAQLSKLLKTYLSTTSKGYFTKCPECELGQLEFSEGCEKCTTCGYSKCS